MCPPFVVDMDAVEGNDKVCGITAFLTTAYAILPQMSRSYVVFGKVRTLPFTTYIFIKPLDDLVQILHALLRPGEGFPLLCQFRLPAGFVLRQHFLGEIIPEQAHIGQRPLNTFQNPPIKRDFPDVVDFTGTCIALIVGADKMIL